MKCGEQRAVFAAKLTDAADSERRLAESQSTRVRQSSACRWLGYTTLEVTHGQILSQSPTDAT